MIVDSKGNPVRRRPGFLGGLIVEQPERKPGEVLPPAVGFEAPADEEERSDQ
jgi:hypothetical protein